MTPFTPQHTYYFHSAWERMTDAKLLQRHDHYVSAIYLFGVAAECMIRAWTPAGNFEGRHDLRGLLATSRLLEGRSARVCQVVSLATRDLMLIWNNSRRYENASRVARELGGVPSLMGFGRGKNREARVLEAAASICSDAAGTIIRVGRAP